MTDGENLTNPKKLRIFHIATEYIVAFSKESAFQYYLELTGDNDPDYIAEVKNEIEIVPRKQWASMKITDTDEPENTLTFQEAFDAMMGWENQDYPKVIATSEY